MSYFEDHVDPATKWRELTKDELEDELGKCRKRNQRLARRIAELKLAARISEEMKERLRARVAAIDWKAELDGPATLSTDESLIRNLADELL